VNSLQHHYHCHTLRSLTVLWLILHKPNNEDSSSSLLGPDAVSLGKQFCWTAWLWEWHNNALEYLEPLTQQQSVTSLSHKTWINSITIPAHNSCQTILKISTHAKQLLGRKWVLHFYLHCFIQSNKYYLYYYTILYKYYLCLQWMQKHAKGEPVCHVCYCCQSKSGLPHCQSKFTFDSLHADKQSETSISLQNKQ
jgi:hypothetical protein